MTGGGVVFGGGEPLLQVKFIHEVCQLADPMWQKRIETSLYSKWEQIQLLVEDMDEWIVDIKDLNPEIYKKYTGKTNNMVLRNLRKLIKTVPKEKIVIRVPFIPGYNSANDVKQSIAILKEMGYSRIDQFEYLDFSNENNASMVIASYLGMQEHKRINDLPKYEKGSLDYYKSLQ
jgi:pyruvate formate lyase activating enzyme